MRLLPRTCLQVKRSRIRNWAITLVAAAIKTSKTTIKMHKRPVNLHHRRRMHPPKPMMELQQAEQKVLRVQPVRRIERAKFMYVNEYNCNYVFYGLLSRYFKAICKHCQYHLSQHNLKLECFCIYFGLFNDRPQFSPLRHLICILNSFFI
jgi:hypothetical protein